MTPHGLIKDKVAFVTGGFNGLGRTIVERFAGEGARGVAADIAEPAPALPEGWFAERADVTDEAQIAASVSAALKRFGRLDVIVANAGMVPPWSETEAIDLAEWDRVFAINVRGVMATIKHAVPAMKAHGGSIVVMCSLNSWRAHPRQCLYTATKHAVLGIVRATALDLGRYDIRVNGIGPGPIATDALTGRVAARAASGGPAPEAAFAAMAAESALGRIATADDVAAAALYLASDLSGGQTGMLMPVDGGLI